MNMNTRLSIVILVLVTVPFGIHITQLVRRDRSEGVTESVSVPTVEELDFYQDLAKAARVDAEAAREQALAAFWSSLVDSKITPVRAASAFATAEAAYTYAARTYSAVSSTARAIADSAYDDSDRFTAYVETADAYGTAAKAAIGAANAYAATARAYEDGGVSTVVIAAFDAAETEYWHARSAIDVADRKILIAAAQ